MLTTEPATLSRFPAGRFESSSRRIPSTFLVPRTKFLTLTSNNCTRKANLGLTSVRASSKDQPEPIKQNPKPQRYHPFEDLDEPGSLQIGEARLTPAETTRTVIEVHSKAMLIISGLINEDLDENLFWPDLPYVTDEHGNIYFRMKNDEDILKSLTSDDNPVLVVVGLDASEMISEISALNQDIDFGFDEIDVEDSDMEDEDEDDDDDDDEDDSDDDEEDDDDGEDDEDGDYENDWEGILEDDEEEDDDEEDESLGDWAKLETMRSSHPMYFAKKLAEFVSEAPVDFMDQPPAGLAIQAILRPAYVEENSVIYKRSFDTSDDQSNSNNNTEKQGDDTIVNGKKQKLEGYSSQDGSVDESLEKGTSFYKLEIIKIQLMLAHGSHEYVDVEDYKRAKPDAIAHSAGKIISRIKAGGEKTMKALQSLCWRSKGIQVEEVVLIGVDSLGFDLRACSGAQVQTLRFAFDKRATSEYGAETQLNNLLFPRVHGKNPKRKETLQTEL